MKKFSSAIHWIVFIIGIIVSLYVGGWVMFIQPIMDACKHFDAGTLTGAIIGATVLKCIFATTVSSLLIWLSSFISAIVATVVDSINNKSKTKKGK